MNYSSNNEETRSDRIGLTAKAFFSYCLNSPDAPGGACSGTDTLTGARWSMMNESAGKEGKGEHDQDELSPTPSEQQQQQQQQQQQHHHHQFAQILDPGANGKEGERSRNNRLTLLLSSLTKDMLLSFLIDDMAYLR
ncbi:hypothetical protein [Absidia glauca]|uniref:Uncharacterized protein n=1 Tax=Absidia glauca TaxID=4829 RepID=A0A168KQN9_ABSGL|nr:hypothetical protein [Absidia glauca]